MRTAVFSTAVLLACSAASAQFSSNFEFPTYLSGEYLSGQDSWAYSPITFDFNVIDFEGNYLGIPPSPQSGMQFVYGYSGTVVVGGQYNTFSAGTQHPVTFTFGGTWTATWDIALAYTGTAPSLSSMGGFALSGGSRTFSLRNFWTTTAGTAWNATFVPANAAGVGASPPVLPDPAFGDLLPRHWYRQSVSWSFDSNRITSVSITDLSTGVQTTVTPGDWYLGGGSTPTGALPTLVKLTVAGGIGPVAAYDNVNVTFVPTPPCYPNCDASTAAPVLNINDFQCFVNKYAAGDSYANCDGSTSVPVLNVNDFQCFIDRFAVGCP